MSAPLKLGCIFPPTRETPAHIELAEELGYATAQVYDSPTLYADPWLTLAQAAQRTSRIRLGVCCITPRLRHVTATASVLVTLETLAPNRVDIAIGSGFTSQLMLGQKPARWAEVEEYATALRALLRGEEIELDGATIALRHPEQTGLRLPVDVPLWIVPHGPKGFAVAERIADGIVTDPFHGSDNPVSAAGKPTYVTFYGTVLDEDEGYGSPRVLAAAGPYAAFQLHLGGEGVASDLEQYRRWTAELDALEPRRRHFETHGAHLIGVTEREATLVTAELIERATNTGPPERIRERLDELGRSGVAGILYGAQGPDIPRELTTMAEVVAGPRV